MGVPVRQRVRLSTDFERLREKGRKIECGPFLMRAMRNESGRRRLGVITSRRVGGAVLRNYGRRVFRELFRLHQDALPQGCDLLVVVRNGFDRFDFSQLRQRYCKACEKLCDILR